MNYLFEKLERTSLAPATDNENTYDYYNKSAREEMMEACKTLEEWFSIFPEKERRELKSRFKTDFDSAFYELFLYQLFSKLGYHITIHPQLLHSRKNPDFLISKDNLEIYVEAKIIKNKSRKQEAFERKKNQFYDDLNNNLKSDRFMLDIAEFDIFSNKQPSTKKVIPIIERELKKITQDQYEEMRKEGFDKSPNIEYFDEDFFITVKPIPVVSSENKQKRRPIGIYPAEVFWGADEETIKDSIKRKAKRYGKFDKPFILCMNLLGRLGKPDADTAVWGSVIMDGSGKRKCEKDGVFQDEMGARLKNLTGILITKVCPHNIHVANYWFYEHPLSYNKMDFKKVGLKFNYVENGYINENTGDDIGEILGFSKG